MILWNPERQRKCVQKQEVSPNMRPKTSIYLLLSVYLFSADLGIFLPQTSRVWSSEGDINTYMNRKHVMAVLVFHMIKIFRPRLSRTVNRNTLYLLLLLHHWHYRKAWVGLRVCLHIGLARCVCVERINSSVAVPLCCTHDYINCV